MKLKDKKALMFTESNLSRSTSLIISFGESEHFCLLLPRHCPDLPGVTYHLTIAAELSS